MVSGRSRRYPETFLDPVAPSWPSISPFWGTATPFNPDFMIVGAKPSPTKWFSGETVTKKVIFWRNRHQQSDFPEKPSPKKWFFGETVAKKVIFIRQQCRSPNLKPHRSLNLKPLGYPISEVPNSEILDSHTHTHAPWSLSPHSGAGDMASCL